MKIKLLFLLISILSWQCVPSNASEQVSHSIEDSSKKPIKNIESYKVNPETGDKTHVSSEHFNDRGEMVKSFYYNTYPDGDTNENNCTYDEKGNLLKCITTDESGNPVYFYEIKYEGENIVEESTNHEVIKYAYDKKGKVILEEEFDSEGNFSQAKKHELEYLEGTTNLKSKTTFEKRGNGDFKIYEKQNYTYDENGQLETETAQTNFYKYHYTYTYYANGNLKEKTTKNGDSEKIITKHHENGKRRAEAIFRSKEPNQPMQLAQKNTWIYDEYDNEIAVENFRNEKLVSKKTREIVYY